jgi:mono/diheme cytochrome c family protein
MRRTLQIVFATAVILVVIQAALLLVGAASGIYDIGADDPHWAGTRRLIALVRKRSIEIHAAAITAPENLTDPAQIARGVEHFDAHCAVCHGAPGVAPGEIAEGLYPKPPNLAVTVPSYSDAELFWIIKHGIKMTGMPSWADHSDEELWAVVGFLRKLPGMSTEVYVNMVAAEKASAAHHHHEDSSAEPAEETAMPAHHQH